MSTIASQGNSVLVDPPEMAAAQLLSQEAKSADIALAGHISTKVDAWEDHRNLGYATRWKEYWRLWRGQWHSSDKNRESERSRLIAPALSQAIEASAAEVEEILLGKEQWFDVAENPGDPENEDTQTSVNSLRYDFALTETKMTCKEAILNASIFGTGIVKLNVQVVQDAQPVRNATGKLERVESEKVFVNPESVRPDEFIPDPAGVTIEEMAGCAVRMTKPMHYVLEKIKEGEYRKEALSSLASTTKTKTGYEVDHGVDVAATLTVSEAEPITITEYHGKVPANLLDAVLNGKSDNPLDALLEEPLGVGEAPLVEAIIVVANDNTLLKAMVNPFTMRDRGIIAFQWEKVPGRFWGRGVGEKGWNPQKGLDSELRSRQDSLGYISAPMLGIDAGRMPRGFKFEVRPGKIWPTNGSPNEIIQPIAMGNLQQATFGQTQEMERMVQMGTGAFDTSSALGAQSQSGANGAGSNSLMMGAFVKRAKRAASTIERGLIAPLIRKSVWRYMQFDPERYPEDFDFRVVGNMGIMAREVESMQMTQLLGMMPQEIAPAVSMAVTKGVIGMSSVTNKAEIEAAIDEAMQPPTEEEAAEEAEMKALEKEMVRAQAQAVILENNKTMAETRKLLNESLLALRQADQSDVKVQQETARVKIQMEELNEMKFSNDLDSRRLDIEEKRVDNDERRLNKEISQNK